MTKVIRVHLSDAAARRLEAEAGRRGMSLARYAGRHLDAEARQLPAVIAKPTACRSVAVAVLGRRWRVDDAAIERAAEPRRSITATLMGDPERPQ